MATVTATVTGRTVAPDGPVLTADIAVDGVYLATVSVPADRAVAVQKSLQKEYNRLNDVPIGTAFTLT